MMPRREIISTSPLSTPYLDSAVELLSSTYRHLEESAMTPDEQSDFIQIRSADVYHVGNIGKIGLELSAFRERDPIYDRLYARQAEIVSHIEEVGETVTISYDSKLDTEGWRWLLPGDNVSSAQTLTTKDTAAKTYFILKQNPIHIPLLYNPNPSSTDFVNSLIGDLGQSNRPLQHDVRKRYIAPISPRKPSKKPITDANVEFISSIDHKKNTYRHIKVLIKFEDIGATKTIEVKAKHARHNDRLVASSARLSIAHNMLNPTLLKLSNKDTDEWEIYRHLQIGAETLRRAAEQSAWVS